MRQYYGKLVKEIRRASSRATSGIVAPGRATSELYQIDEHRKIIKSSTIEFRYEVRTDDGELGIKNGATQGVSCVSQSPTVRRLYFSLG
jgi:hypothetical protein